MNKLALFASQMTLLTLFDPHEGIREVDEALGGLGDSEAEQAWRQFAWYFESMCVACLGDFESAAELAQRSMVPEDSELRDFALTTWLWFSHVAGSAVDADVVDLARSADPRDGYWRQSVGIAAALHAGDEEAVARELVSVADRGWNGLLVGEEAEYLTAFARLAHLRNDPARALELLASSTARSPWNVAAMTHTLASIEDWPSDEWSTRLTQLVLDRAAPDRVEHLTRTAGPLLTEELNRWR